MNLKNLLTTPIEVDTVYHGDVKINVHCGMSVLEIAPEWGDLVVDKIEVYDRKLIVTIGNDHGDNDDFGNEDILGLMPDDQYVEIDVWTWTRYEVTEGRKSSLLSSLKGSKLFEMPILGVSSESGEGYEDTLLITFSKQEE